MVGNCPRSGSRGGVPLASNIDLQPVTAKEMRGMWPKRDAYRYDLPRAQRLGAIVTMHRLKWGRKSRIQIAVRCALPSLTDHVSGKAERAFKRHLRACAVSGFRRTGMDHRRPEPQGVAVEPWPDDVHVIRNVPHEAKAASRQR